MLDDSKKFEILFESLKEVYKGHIENNVKVIGILLVVVGWFAASGNPLPFLCNNLFLVVVALVSVIFGEIALIFLGLAQYRRSQRIYKSLITIEEDLRLYSNYTLSKPMLLAASFGHFIILFGIFFLIYAKYLPVESACK